MTRKKKTTLLICLAVALALCIVALLLGRNAAKRFSGLYTWEEYQALSLEEQDAFFQQFGSEEAFEEWMEMAQTEESEILVSNWDKSGKDPDGYTWEEYQALSNEEQDAFFLWFDTENAFEAWMATVKPEESTPLDLTWDKPGKKPDAYTWEEYQALSAEEQEVFYQWFDSETDYEAWLECAKPDENAMPILDWNEAKKNPDMYTWEEYQALSYEEQDAFFLWFDTEEAFEAWMTAVKPEESEPTAASWDKMGKIPNEYTWEEYQALSLEEQDAFYLWFGSIEAFEAWMTAASAS